MATLGNTNPIPDPLKDFASPYFHTSYSEASPIPEEPAAPAPDDPSESTDEYPRDEEAAGDETYQGDEDPKSYYWESFKEDEPPIPGFWDDFGGSSLTDYRYKVLIHPKDDYEVVVMNMKTIKLVKGFHTWKNQLPANEFHSKKFTAVLLNHIKEQNGTFLKDQSGDFHVILGNRRISLGSPQSGTAPAMSLIDLMLKICDISTKSPVAQMVIERLQREASLKCSDMSFRRFSAAYDGEEPRIYLPTDAEAKLLCISTGGCEVVPNGHNPDALWLEHPKNDGLRWVELNDAEIRQSLLRFEELLVHTQACRVDSMRWFVGMAEGFFPYIRDFIHARFITTHVGPGGSGKTTGGLRFTKLHGNGDVTIDSSVAALNNDQEQGLLVLDNKEQRNLTKELLDWLLRAATGGDHARSKKEGELRHGTSRPVVVLTTIEGMKHDELIQRCVEVEYVKQEPIIPQEPIEHAIVRERHQIRSAFAKVLQEYLTVRVDPTVHIPQPSIRFIEHFTELGKLLIAYGRVMGRFTSRGDEWAMEIINSWVKTVSTTDYSEATSEHEQPILEVLRSGFMKSHPNFSYADPKTDETHTGKLSVTTCSELIQEIRRNNPQCPTVGLTAAALGKRLRSDRFSEFTVLGEESGISLLKRSNKNTPIGFFQATTANDERPLM